MAQGTVERTPIQYAVDVNLDPVSGALATFTAAGTDDLIAIYADVGLETPLDNPLEADGDGIFPEVFLAPGVAYDKDVTDPDGVSLPGYPRVDLLSVPLSEQATSVTGTVGVAVLSTQVGYLSDGSGGLIAGQWYLADSDLAYASSLPEIGVFPSDIAISQSGTIQVGGRVSGFTGLTPGASYYVSSTAGAITTTAGANPRYVGQADSTTSIVLSPNPPLKTGGFATFTTTWTGASGNPAIGNGTKTSSYLQIGKLVFLRINLNMGSTTTYGTGQWTFSLPVAAAAGTGAAGGYSNGHLEVFDSSAGSYSIGLAAMTTSVCAGIFSGTTGVLGSAIPIAWATGDVVAINVWYEAA